MELLKVHDWEIKPVVVRPRSNSMNGSISFFLVVMLSFGPRCGSALSRLLTAIYKFKFSKSSLSKKMEGPATFLLFGFQA